MTNEINKPNSTKECMTCIRSSDANLQKIGFEKLTKLIYQKADLLRKSYGIQNSRMEIWKHNIQNYSNNPTTLINIATSDKVFAALLKSPINAALQLGNPQYRIVDKIGGQILTLFPGDRLVFANSYKKLLKNQTWLRWNIDKANSDHAPGKKPTKNKSTFERSIVLNELLEIVLGNPIGFLRSDSTLMLYGCLSSIAGTLSIKQGRKKTKYFLFQCDREERPKKRDGGISGYRTRCHGYPVSVQEVRDQFERFPELAKKLSL